MQNIIGIDFSISKTACCVFSNNEFNFFLFPKEIKNKLKELYLNNGVNIIERTTEHIDDITKYDIINASNLADLIISTLKQYLENQTLIAFEGSSFASRGNVTLSLTAWRYILIYKLINIIPIDNIFTYSPISVKSIAGCAKKGMNKKDMINAFIEKGPECEFRKVLKETPELFMKKGGNNWFEGTDDIIDSYYVLETLRRKRDIQLK